MDRLVALFARQNPRVLSPVPISYKLALKRGSCHTCGMMQHIWPVLLIGGAGRGAHPGFCPGNPIDWQCTVAGGGDERRAMTTGEANVERRSTVRASRSDAGRRTRR
jgi:hypothetical protein